MKYGLILLVGILLFSPLIVAQPTTTIYSFPQGYTIVPTEYEQLKAGEDFNFFFYLYNTSNGLKIDNTTVDCDFHIADSQGNLVLEASDVFNPNGYWYTFVNGSYVAESGYYYYGVDCQDGLGGALSGVFEVTPNGKPNPDTWIIIIFSLIFIVIICFGVIHFLKCLEYVIQFKMTIYDTATLMFTYFAMWFFYYFSQEYFGNKLVEEFLEIAINIGAVTHVFLALVGFLTSYILSTIKFNQKNSVTY